jgi:hypothetical protein
VDQAARVARVYALVVAGLSALALAGIARAEDPSPAPPRPLPPTAGIGQYVEDVPSAAGPRAAGDAKPRPARLSKRARKQLTKVDKSTARMLERIATASAYGAPEVKTPEVKPTKRTAEPKANAQAPTGKVGSSSNSDRTDPSAGSAVASAVGGEENGNLEVVLGALVVFSVAAVGAAVARARRARAR